MLSLARFISKYKGRKIEFDGAYYYQCVDLIKYWVSNLGLPMTYGNGNQYARNADGKNYIWIKNTPSGVPRAGDIIVFNTKVGKYGHVSIFIHGDVNHFESFDQNWPVGNACAEIVHDYTGVAGWLRMPVLDKKPTPKPTPKPKPKPKPIDPHIAEILQLKELLRKANARIDELENMKPKTIIKTIIKEVPFTVEKIIIQERIVEKEVIKVVEPQWLRNWRKLMAKWKNRKG